MKNIRFYNAIKYTSDEYTFVEENIYKTLSENNDDGCFSLEGLQDEKLMDILRKMDGWIQGTGDYLEDYRILNYEGKTYYREIDDEEDWIFVNMNEDPTLVYVTSIVFEPEPEYEENAPTDSFVSQYPLEDILDKFFCMCFDDYREENESDLEHSYVEFASEDIEDIRNVLSILGKHVYNKTEGKYVKLIIE